MATPAGQPTERLTSVAGKNLRIFSRKGRRSHTPHPRLKLVGNMPPLRQLAMAAPMRTALRDYGFADGAAADHAGLAFAAVDF